jgi:hypothetical protein
MKRLISVILFFFSMCCYAGDSIRYYAATSFSYKKVVNGEWTDWSEWEESGMIITMNITKDVVEILSPKAQIYNITENKGLYFDQEDGRNVNFSFVDQDGDKGTMRLRIEKNGNSQMYIEYANVMWVYNLIRIEGTDL